MKDMKLKEAKDNLKIYIKLVLHKNYCECNELNVISCGNYCDGSKNVAEATETILKYIAELEIKTKKQNRMIDEMVKVIIASSICDYFIKDNCKHYAGENKKQCDECIKQYFEKKVGNNNVEK